MVRNIRIDDKDNEITAKIFSLYKTKWIIDNIKLKSKIIGKGAKIIIKKVGNLTIEENIITTINSNPKRIQKETLNAYQTKPFFILFSAINSSKEFFLLNLLAH